MMEAKELSPEQAKAVLSEIIDAINSSDNAAKIKEAKDNAGNDMSKIMQLVFPIMVRIEMDVVKNYGFPESREGIVYFFQLIRNLERTDSDVADLVTKVKSYFMPPVNINTEASL